MRNRFRISVDRTQEAILSNTMFEIVLNTRKIEPTSSGVSDEPVKLRLRLKDTRRGEKLEISEKRILGITGSRSGFRRIWSGEVPDYLNSDHFVDGGKCRYNPEITGTKI